MKIVFIGAGAVATNLSNSFFKKGHRILQIISQNASSASSLAREYSCSFSTDLEKSDSDADMTFICVKDQVLESVIEKLPISDGIFIHTSGSTSINILEKKFKNCGVFYPLQTFSKFKKVDLKSSPVFIEGNDETSFKQIEALAYQISETVIKATSQQRLALHVCGVFASNFSNHMYTLAYHLAKKHNVSFNVLFPLIKETAEKITLRAPATSQTGPAIRNEINILEKHKNFLKSEPDLLNIYNKLSESIIKFSH